MSLVKKIYIWSSPFPILLFFALSVYVKRYDGWGAWAAAPMLLPPVFLSLVMFLTGAGFVIHSRKMQEPYTGILIATIIASSLFLFLLGRAILMELAKSFL